MLRRIRRKCSHPFVVSCVSHHQSNFNEIPARCSRRKKESYFPLLFSFTLIDLLVLSSFFFGSSFYRAFLLLILSPLPNHWTTCSVPARKGRREFPSTSQLDTISRASNSSSSSTKYTLNIDARSMCLCVCIERSVSSRPS